MAQPNPHLRKRLPIKPTLKRHPLSAVFGDMSAGELLELQADIDEHGLREPIVLLDGMILDGWHRYQCLCNLGKQLAKSMHYEFDPAEDGESPEALVYSKNLFRRQLSAEDRVRLAAKVMGYEATGRGGKPKTGVTMEQVAETAKVSKATAVRALKKQSSTMTLRPTGPTLESLKKREAMLEGQLTKVREQIASLTPKRRR